MTTFILWAIMFGGFIGGTILAWVLRRRRRGA